MNTNMLAVRVGEKNLLAWSKEWRICPAKGNGCNKELGWVALDRAHSREGICRFALL